MGKKTPRQKAIKYADDQMSLYIRARDGHCVQCGKIENLTNGHLITRNKYATRWAEENCYCQCTGCNLRHEHQAEIFTDWWIRQNGEEAYHALVLKSNTPHKFSTQEIREIGDYYKAEREELENERD